MKYLHIVVIALLAGAIGGSIGTFAVLTHRQARPESVIRAHRFELVDDTGRVSSFWGVDPAGYEVLAFQRPRRTEVGTEGKPDQQLALGLEGKAGRPFLGMYGADGQIRVLLNLDDFQRPSLAMSDGASLGITLGSERSDTPGVRDKTERWALNFLPEERARIGIFTEVDQRRLYARGFLHVNPKKVSYFRSMP